MPAPFIHLHNHSEYSLLDATCRVNSKESKCDLVDQAVANGMDAVALTDHGNLFGAVDFYKAAVKAEVKPILGCEFYMTRGSRFDRSVSNQKDRYNHLVLLAKNNNGYQNLMRLASLAYTEGFYYKPRIDRDLLSRYGSDLFCLTACLKGEVPQLLLDERIDKARAVLEEYSQFFDKDSLFLELQENGIAEQSKVNKGMLELAKDMGLPLVATNDVHYPTAEDFECHDILLCVQTQKTEDDPNRMRYGSQQFYFKSAEEMAQAFDYAPEAIANTRLIADACNVEIALDNDLRPDYPLPGEYKERTYTDYLRDLVEKGVRERYEEITPEIRERIEFELSVIKQMGYDSYFLIVWDFIDFARRKGIAVGPGRGSAAGSIVAYCLGITDLDPLEYDLLFERFLNPERVSMPDIDVDFSDKRRDEVIRYVSDKYGQDSVAQIATFGKMKAKMVVRDVGRALGYPASECDRVAKMIPGELKMTIDQALKDSEDLRDWVAADQRNERLIRMAKKLEGLRRQSSTHAAGIVIAKGDLRQYTPLMKTNKDEVACQFEMKSVENLGLLKMDFLGLRTLSIIEDTLGFLKEREIDLDLKTIPMDDEKTFGLLGQARTTGVFQLESMGMKEILKKMHPESFSDVIALLALYRPGPLGSGMVDDFIDRKLGKKEITYDLPMLEPILKETYGIILYQEQVMKIVSAVGGFSLGQADLMRRAMGKKDQATMDKMEKEFIAGAEKNSVPKAIAEKLWKLINYFAGYGFNKSHSAAYAVLSYQTAYLKAHYPAEFMAALLTNEINNTDRVVRLANDCRSMGIKILPPCVNDSKGTFTVKGDRIRFGLSGVKNVGSSAVRSIIQTREKDGPFKSLLDFCERVDLSACNSKVLESLVLSGAMDCLGRSRAEHLELLPEAQERATGAQRDRMTGQTSLFDSMELPEASDLPVRNTEELAQKEILKNEKQLLGIYLSGHPLDEYAEELELFSTASTLEIAEKEDLSAIRIAGVIAGVSRKTTKNGDRMAMVTLEDMQGQVELVVFPDTFRTHGEMLQPETVIVVEGDGENRGGRVSVRVSKIWTLERAQEELIQAVHLYLDNSHLEKTFLEDLKRRVSTHRGQAALMFHISLDENDQVVIRAGEQYQLRPGPALKTAISEIKSNLRLSYDVRTVSHKRNGNGRRR